MKYYLKGVFLIFLTLFLVSCAPVELLDSGIGSDIWEDHFSSDSSDPEVTSGLQPCGLNLSKKSDVIHELRRRFNLNYTEVSDDDLEAFLKSSDNLRFARIVIIQHALGERIDAFIKGSGWTEEEDASIEKQFLASFSVKGMLAAISKIAAEYTMLSLRLMCQAISILLNLTTALDAIQKFVSIVEHSYWGRELITFYIEQRNSGRSPEAVIAAAWSDPVYGTCIDYIMASKLWWARNLSDSAKLRFITYYLETKYSAWRMGTQKNEQEAVKHYIISQTRFNFKLFLNKYSETVLQGKSIKINVEAQKVAGTAGLVKFSILEVPNGVTCTPAEWTAELKKSKTFEIKISIAASARPGVYNIVIKGESGDIIDTTSFKLTIESPLPDEFIRDMWIYVHHTNTRKGWNWLILPSGERLSVPSGKYVQVKEVKPGRVWQVGFEDLTEEIESDNPVDWDYDEPLLTVELLSTKPRKFRIKGVQVTGIYYHDLWVGNKLIYEHIGGDIFNYGEWIVTAD